MLGYKPDLFSNPFNTVRHVSWVHIYATCAKCFFFMCRLIVFNLTSCVTFHPYWRVVKESCWNKVWVREERKDDKRGKKQGCRGEGRGGWCEGRGGWCLRKLSEVTYCLSLGVAAEAWGRERKKGNRGREGKRLVWVSTAGSEDEMAGSLKSSQG